MCSSCTHDYYSRPFDFQLSNNAYRKLFENRDQQHFTITIDDVTYDFKLKLSQESDINYIVKTIKNGKKSSNLMDSFSLDDVSESNDMESNNHNSSESRISSSEKRELLRRLFIGKSIMIDDLNIDFLHHAAEAIEIPELLQINNLTKKSCAKQSNQFIFYYKQNIYKIKDSIKSLFFHIWTNIFDFFCFFGFFGRVLQTFWDLSGPTMIFCLFLNILILFITMALVTLKDYLVWFFIVVIPFLLYSLYFPNIISISIIEALERNLYLKKTFFYSHQKLISMLIKVLFDIDSIPKYINLGKLHPFIHGILFVTFMCGFFANVINDKAPRFLNVWMIIFVFYIPLIRYFSLYIFYLVHSFVSLFNKPRRRFLEIGDFEDPYLCSFYLNERNWIDFFINRKKQSKFTDSTHLLLRFVFSKTTFSLLATIAVIVYMICAETKMSAGQVCITIFIGICMIFVLATRISFPFFWINRIRNRRLTEGKIKENRENIRMNANKRILKFMQEDLKESESQYIHDDDEEKVEKNENELEIDDEDNEEYESEELMNKLDQVEDDIKEMILRKEVLKWHQQATIWSKRYKYLRWCSIILVSLTLVFVIVLVSMGGSTAVGSSKDPNEYLGNITINRPINSTNTTEITDNFYPDSVDDNHEGNDTLRFPLSPICYMKPKGLSITEIIALSMLANPPSQDTFSDEQWQIVDEFINERGEIGKDVLFVNTPFLWDKSFQSSMTLTRFRKDSKLSVFTIRGTANTQDVIADAEIWFASVVINIMNAFFPLVNIYSDKTMEMIGVVTNLPRYAFKQFSLVEEYKNRFVDYINEYLNGESDFHIDPDEDVMIIGHSLGGGLAKIISLVTGIQAVALSGPGVRFIGHFYQSKTAKNVKETIVDVIPGQDLIARVDMSLGTQINVPCKRGMTCHETNRLICQVAVMCNTFSKHAQFCEEKFDHDTIEEMFKIGEVVT